MAAEEIIEVPASTVLWKIENVSFWNRKIHDWEISSPKFQLCNLGENEWTISLFPKGEEDEYESDDEDDENNTLFSIRPSVYKRDVSVDCEWSLLDENGVPILIQDEEYVITDAECKHEMPDCPTYKDVFLARKHLFLPHDTLTLRLRVRKCYGDFTLAENLTAVTRFKVQQETFKWRIEKFNSLPLHRNVISNVSVGGDVFRLVLSLTGATLSDASVIFKIVAESSRKQSVTVKLSVLDQEEREIKYLEQAHVFRSSILEQTLVVQEFLTRQEMLQDVFDDDLTLLCKFTSVLPELHQCIERSYYGPTNLDSEKSTNVSTAAENSTVPRTTISSFLEWSSKTNSVIILQEDLLSLFTDHMLSDFELRTGDHSIPVHKAILSARSPVFKATFSNNMKESHSNFEEVPDVDVDTLGQMLSFMYTGAMETDMPWKNVAKLYYAADKYQILSLKQECSSVLQCHITVSNVGDILELADRHNDEKLTLCVHDFIEIHFDDVVRSAEWDEFLQRSCLAGTTMKTVYIKKASK